MQLNPSTLELDDRREIWMALKWLGRLNPFQRIAFLRWCCKQVRGPDGIAEVRITSHSGTVVETYNDLLMLCFVHHLNLDVAVAKLIELVRRL
jgi:hypothetical protein